MISRHAATAAAIGTGAAFLILRRLRHGREAAVRLAAASLESLLNAIDANDPDTGAHVRRVAVYALILADAAGVSERERGVIERVALFHDIGKIHEALFDIIHDVKKLTPAERREMLTHPQRGADVLRPLSGFHPDLPDGVLSHHEKWNGTGYPRGLKGRHIPLSARIVAIADTFDAITHRRQYSEGRTVEVAREILLQGRGTQFDPELIDLFMFPGVFERIVRAHDRVSKWRAPVKQRQPGREEDQVPDVTFRWRPVRGGSRKRQQTGQPRRTPH